MVTDTAAAERMVDRLLAVKFDDDAAFEHRRSRSRLAREFLRRTAQWAQALGTEKSWPFGDLAGALDSEVAVDPALLARLEIDPSAGKEFPIWPEVGAVIVRWAALGDLPRQRFAALDDPYEPLLALFERGGGYSLGHGSIELGYGSFPLLTLADRAALEPRPIDPATLDQLDLEG
ncbi:MULTISPECIES: hypothetical protein [unclassified Kribbella]|uniref:hypothetical protein n=1 Tax=unclassified Kribbella TaxID=2644121 RepID=UPI00301A638B